MATMHQERERFHAAKADEQAQQFRSEIGLSIDLTAAKSRTSREQCEAAAHMTNSLLSMASEVAASTQQSASAMTEAAETSGGIKTSIDTNRHDHSQTVSALHGATDEVGERLNSIRAVSQTASGTNRTMLETFSTIRDSADRLNFAIKEQSSNVTRIAACVDETAASAESSTELFGETSSVIEGIAGDLDRVAQLAIDLNGDMGKLKKHADGFVETMTVSTH